jgi:hypothetical protein
MTLARALAWRKFEIGYTEASGVRVTRSIVPTESALADHCGKGRSLTLANGRFWHFGDIDAARFNVRFRALFGHQSMARLCRRMTQSGLLRVARRREGKAIRAIPSRREGNELAAGSPGWRAA